MNNKIKMEYEELYKTELQYLGLISNDLQKSKHKILLKYCNNNQNNMETNSQDNQILTSEYIRAPSIKCKLKSNSGRIPIYKHEYKHLVREDINCYYRKSRIARQIEIKYKDNDAISHLNPGEYDFINTVIANSNNYKFLIDDRVSENEQCEQVIKILTSNEFPDYYNNLVTKIVNHYFKTKSEFKKHFKKLDNLITRLHFIKDKDFQNSYNMIKALNYNRNNNESISHDIYDVFFKHIWPLIFYLAKAPEDVVATCNSVKQTIANYKLVELYTKYCNNFETYLNDICSYLYNNFESLQKIKNNFNEQDQSVIKEYIKCLKVFYEDFIINNVDNSIKSLEHNCELIIRRNENSTIGNCIDPEELYYNKPWKFVNLCNDNMDNGIIFKKYKKQV